MLISSLILTNTFPSPRSFEQLYGSHEAACQHRESHVEVYSLKPKYQKSGFLVSVKSRESENFLICYRFLPWPVMYYLAIKEVWQKNVI